MVEKGGSMDCQFRHLGSKILEHRKRKRLTQQALASRMGISRTAIASWETGRVTPSDDQLNELSDSLGIDVSLLRPQAFRVPNFIEKIKETCLNELGDLTEKLSSEILEATFSPAWDFADMDVQASKRFQDFIRKRIAPECENGIILFSEEEKDDANKLKPIFIRNNGEVEEDVIDPSCGYYVILDPIDRSTEAARSIAGFSHFSICSFEKGPLFSIVCALFNPYISFYYAVRGQGAFIKIRKAESKPIKPIFPSKAKNLKGAYIGAYTGRPGRLKAVSKCEKLFEKMEEESVIVNTSGSYGFALAASGQIDAFIEVMKGYRWHDIISGAHILQEAGGVVMSLEFGELVDPFLDFSGDIDAIKERLYFRQRFLSAGTYQLAGKVCRELARDEFDFEKWDEEYRDK